MVVAIKKIIGAQWRIIGPRLAGRQGSERCCCVRKSERRYIQLITRGIVEEEGREWTLRRAKLSADSMSPPLRVPELSSFNHAPR